MRSTEFMVLGAAWGLLSSACDRREAKESPSASASAALVQLTPNSSITPQAAPPAVHTSIDPLRIKNRAKLETPPTKPPADALAGPGGVRWQLIENGHESPISGQDALVADITVWKTDGIKASSTFDMPKAGSIRLDSVSPEFRGLLGKLKAPAIARYWIPKAAHAAWHPQGWPDADLIVQVDAYFAARNTGSTRTEGDKPAASGPPPDALVAANGYRYQTLTQGGNARVSPDKAVTLVWSAWVVQGLLVRKINRNERTQTTLDKVPGAMGPLVAGMHVGEKRRVWVPKANAAAISPDAKGLDLIVDLLVQQ